MGEKNLLARAAAFARKHEWPIFRLAVLAGAAGAAALFLLFGPPHLIILTETPAFCAICHEKPQYYDWEHSVHRRAKCIDCHLPNGNPVSHYFWKGVDGNKDVFYEFTGLTEHDEIRLSAHGRRVLQANCLRCHGEMVSRIGTERACTDCHRRAGHKGQARTATTEELK